jgi:hypothetical protein
VLEILIAVLAFGILVAIMAIGVLVGRKPISGSCGGVAAALGEDDYNCEICGDDPAKCDEFTEQQSDESQFTEVTIEKS